MEDFDIFDYNDEIKKIEREELERINDKRMARITTWLGILVLIVIIIQFFLETKK